MRANAVSSLIAVILLAMTPNTPAADPVADLARIDRFAFGGVGYAGTTSNGEKAFREILGGKDALAQFRSVLEKGSAEGRLYALCGIRILDPAGFADAARALARQDPKVTTIAGCMLSQSTASGVIRNIERGHYDRHWSKK